MESVWNQLAEKMSQFWITLLQNSGSYLWTLLTIVVILLGARLILAVVSRATRKVMENRRYHRDAFQGKRVDTIMTLSRSVMRYAIYFVAIMMILSQLGFEGVTRSLLGAAGIGSLAIGFGAQNLVKDVVTGFFMMFENQFSVGDYIQTETDEGFVEATAMRVTYLRTFKGEQVIIPNGTISRVVNHTRGGAVAEVIVSTAYEADTRQVMGIIQQAVDRYAAAHQDLIQEMPVVPGIQSLGASSVDIVIRCKVKSLNQWEVERGIRLAVKEEFDRLGVEFPYPRVVLASMGEHAPKTVAPAAPEEESRPPVWASAEDDD